MRAPEKIYFDRESIESIPDDDPLFNCLPIKENDNDIEYTRTDAFIEKAKKWFKEQTEYTDIEGDYHWDENWFEDFKNYMKGGKV